MRQERINSVGQALRLAADVMQGAANYGETLGLVHHTAADVRADDGALRACIADVDQARIELEKLQQALKAEIPVAITFVTFARELLKLRLGKTHSVAWDCAGYVGSFEIPRNATGLSQLARRLATYLEENPSAQSIEHDVTAARALALYNSLLAKNRAMTMQRVTMRKALSARDAAFQTLSKRLRNVCKELSHVLSPMDGKWLVLGFNIPGKKQTPEVPENVTVIPIDSSTAEVKWDRAARAEYYHVRLKVQGVDEEPRLVGSRKDTDIMLEDLPANATVEVGISAINSGGESRSAIVIITTGERPHAEESAADILSAEGSA